MSPDQIESFLEARAGRPRWIGVAGEHRPTSEVEGYRLQAAIHSRLVQKGATLAGYKVGSTSPRGQAALGLSEPIYAGIFVETQRASLRDALSVAMVAPLVECEVAVVLGADVDGSVPSLTPSGLAEAIASCHLACEIVDNRYGEPLEVGIPTLLADDFFHVGFVLGPSIPGWGALDLAALDADISVDGTVFQATSADVLSPLASIAWLARKLAVNGLRLRAGQIVLTGSIVPPVPLASSPVLLSLGIAGFGRMDLRDVP